jgi:hypothetical protein
MLYLHFFQFLFFFLIFSTNMSSDSTTTTTTTTTPKEPMLQFFEYSQLPDKLKEVSQPFCFLACQVVQNLPQNPERSACLRKLLEAKDCAVRASIYKNVN